MSFHKQIERQMAQEFAPNQATILVDYNDVVFYGRRLQAQEMGRLFGLAVRAVVKGVKWLYRMGHQNRIASMNDYMRRDIGLSPIGGSTGRGYI
jgi:predicted DNA-binding transcriptional regulator|tara:strand:- start:70 stop:351 length:282 start_codon:yes stop_codon:yes gene_type:complete